VDAQIDIDTVMIQGQVHGTIKAKTRIEMHPPAVVKGDISSPNLIISEGAIFEGSCSMGRDQGQVLELSQAKEVEDLAPEPKQEPELVPESEPVPEPVPEVDSLF